MKRILLMACAVVGLNAFAKTAKSPTQFTLRANAQELLLGNFASELNYNLDSNISVGVFGNYNPGNNYGTISSLNYAAAAAKVSPFDVVSMERGFGIGASGNYYFESNQSDSAFAGLKVSYESGKVATFTGKDSDAVKKAKEGMKAEAKAEYDGGNLGASSAAFETGDENKAIDRSFVKVTAPVGYQWVFSNGVNVSTSAELGFRYTLTEKLNKDEKSFKVHAGLNLLNVGMNL